MTEHGEPRASGYHRPIGLDARTLVSGFSGSLKRALVNRCLAGAAEITYRMLQGKSGPRDFRRIVIVAPLGRQNGIAQAARLQWQAMRQLGIDAELIDAAQSMRNPLFRVSHCPGSVYIVHAGGPQSPLLLASVLSQAANAYRIAFWAWELPEPPDWSGHDRGFAEIWTPSRFAKASLARMTNKPVHVVPHYVPAGAMRQRNPQAPLTILAMADTRSSLTRKNPEGALRAFHLGFDGSRSARLVLKLQGRVNELNAFERSCADLLRSCNVEIIRQFLDETTLTDLYRTADVFLSLHRAEGFGLPMAEAMAHGIPVVATGWSGNLDFMSHYDSELIPYTLIPVSDQSAIYDHGVWAEPDIEAAAQALRRLADDPDHYAQRAAAAYRRALAAAPQFPFATCSASRIIPPSVSQPEAGYSMMSDIPAASLQGDACKTG